MEESHQPLPSYDEESAKTEMEHTYRIVKAAKNVNSEDDDFENRINK